MLNWWPTNNKGVSVPQNMDIEIYSKYIITVTVHPLSPPPPLMTLTTRRPQGRRRSESPEVPPVPSCSRDLPAAAACSWGTAEQVQRQRINDAAGGESFSNANASVEINKQEIWMQASEVFMSWKMKQRKQHMQSQLKCIESNLKQAGSQGSLRTVQDAARCAGHGTKLNTWQCYNRIFTIIIIILELFGIASVLLPSAVCPWCALQETRSLNKMSCRWPADIDIENTVPLSLYTQIHSVEPLSCTRCPSDHQTGP